MNMTVLLADDDDDDRMLFEEVFAKLPLDVYTLKIFENGRDVLSYLKTLDDQPLPRLIILDQFMPQMNGKETLTELKSSDKFKEIPVIIYSTYNDANFIRECENLGVFSVVSKPHSYEGYIEMINRFLRE